jgi:hypothetical protein
MICYGGNKKQSPPLVMAALDNPGPLIRISWLQTTGHRRPVTSRLYCVIGLPGESTEGVM